MFDGELKKGINRRCLFAVDHINLVNAKSTKKYLERSTPLITPDIKWFRYLSNPETRISYREIKIEDKINARDGKRYTIFEGAEVIPWKTIFHDLSKRWVSIIVPILIITCLLYLFF